MIKYLLFFLLTLTACHNTKTMITPKEYQLDFDTFYNQFYIVTDLDWEYQGEIWTDQNFDDRMGTFEYFVNVGTETYGHIKGIVKILDKKNDNYKIDDYDHIVEGGIRVVHNNLYITDCPNNDIEKQISLPNGIYRIRVYSKNLIGVNKDLMENNDYYIIEIFPGNTLEKKVIKRFELIQ